jgi:hypothetical protein
VKLKSGEPLSNFTFKINLRRYNVRKPQRLQTKHYGRALQVDSIKTRAESACGANASNYNIIYCFQRLLSISSCASILRYAPVPRAPAATRAVQAPPRYGGTA